MRRTGLRCVLPGVPLGLWIGAAGGALAAEAPLEEIAGRLRGLIEQSARAQFGTASELPPDRSFAVGQYPALIDFHVLTARGLEPVLEDVVDASGSSFIGLWFLSQSHRILGEVEGLDTGALRAALRAQIERARELPRFFQGTTEDVWSCPPETMGWYPLVDGYRLQALLPDAVERRLPEAIRKDLANLSDGDIWAWCLAIDDTTPGILEYNLPITATDIYAPLLGSRQEWSHLDPASQDLYRRVRGEGGVPRFPLGTFYGTSAEKLQHFSSVVNANILASIPLLDHIPREHERDIENAVRFVDDATRMALGRRLSWRRFAYDYYTIPVAPIAYVVRAHKRILEIGRTGYPRLLSDGTVAAAARYVRRQTRALLDRPDLYTPEGATAYASLVYCFSAMMNLGAFAPDLVPTRLVDRTMRALLTPNPASHTVPGTGPYRIAFPVWADMASICFIVPPLIEAFSLYLLRET